MGPLSCHLVLLALTALPHLAPCQPPPAPPPSGPPAPTPPNIITKGPLHPKKKFEFFQVLSFPMFISSHLTWVQSHLACSPPHENNIFQKFPKKSRNNPDSINKVTLYESPKNTRILMKVYSYKRCKLVKRIDSQMKNFFN